MHVSLAVLAACLGLAVATDALAQDNYSQVTVIDGDTLDANGQTIRLYGIDAPELGQYCLNGKNRYRCGYEAALNLRKLVRNKNVECRATPVDASDEGQICSVELVDLAESMLRHGHAIALPSALAFYRKAEREAKSSKVGVWRGEFVPPSEWRAGRRLPTTDDAPMQSCDIKGLVSDKGERVYLVSTDPAYERVNVSEARGERLFCSDDQAEFAGWRRWPKAAIQSRLAVQSD